MYSIGLDVGIASVGYSVIDSKTGHIIELGSRLFSSRNSDDNSIRRDKRGTRRLLRRRVTRLSDAKKILFDNGFNFDANLENKCPYELRVKGLREEISKEEIYKIVLHILKKRGVSYLASEDIDSENESKDFRFQVLNNQKLLKDLTPGEIQFSRLNEGGRVRSGINKKGEFKLNIFSVDSYADELNRIFDEQKNHHQEITKEFIDLFTKKGHRTNAGLIYRKRPYYDGPGNEKQNSPYGRWAEYRENGKPAENIFDQLIGKDIKGKIRASNLGPSAQRYNLLNDLNNLRVISRENERLTTVEKQKIIDKLETNRPKSYGPSNIASDLGLKLEEIKGWRIDKKEKPLIHSMKEFSKWRNIFEEHALNIHDAPVEVLENVASLVTLNTEKEAFELSLDDEMDRELKGLFVENFHELRQAKPTNSWHSFSAHTLQLLIPELLNTSDEQNTILERFDLKVAFKSKYKDKKYLPATKILEEIYNPTVRKSVRQSINVLNALVKKYGKKNIDYLTIEMPRDKNEDEQKKTIKNIQKNFETKNKESRAYFLTKSGWTESQFESKLRSSKRFASKLYYYYEQDGLCAYSGQQIHPEELTTEKVEIDHIIPLSISIDDSRNNKVLVRAFANQEKGQRSPLQAFREDAKFGRDVEEFKAWVISRKYKKYKRDLLLEENNIFDPEIKKKFVARNLNDTRYSSRILLNAIQSFFYNSRTKLRVVNGSYTHTLRKKWTDYLKDRDTHHHHAVDATLVAVSPFVKLDRFEYRYNEEENKPYMVDTKTGEIVSYSEYKRKDYYDKHSYTPEFNDFIEQLLPAKLYSKIKFSHQVDRKFNRKLSDETIYSTRDVTTLKGKGKNQKEITETYVIGYISDIYTPEGYSQFAKKRNSLLLKEIDPKTFEKLVEIETEFNDYVEVENQRGEIKRVNKSPFQQYREKYNVPGVTKYAKKNNGPIVRKVKYREKKLNDHYIDITSNKRKQNSNRTENNKQVVMLNNTPWRTDVYYSETENKYYLMGIKYSHLIHKGNEYGITQNQYKILKELEDVPENAIFKFSLYKKDLIEIVQGNNSDWGLYHSRNYSQSNYFEMKPINKKKWDSKELLNIFGNVAASGQFIKGIKQGMKVRKYHVDILGNSYLVRNEELSHILLD